MTLLSYRPDIDGLRALAVLPVIFFHAGFPFFSGGFIGVDIFFVISGYLICSILLHDLANNTFSILKFYERRARRILPALVFVLVTSTFMAWLWMFPEDFIEYAGSLISVSTFISNIFFWKHSDYFDTSAEFKPLLHTWSLAVEEQYYIFFPLILWGLFQYRKSWIMPAFLTGTILSLGVAEWSARYIPDAAFFLLPMRGWELLSGAMAAYIFYSTDHNRLSSRYITISQQHPAICNLLSFLGLSLVAFSILFFDKNTAVPGIITIVPVLGTVLIILFSSSTTLCHRLLSSKLMVSIGLISYSAYLWHQPLFAFARIRMIHMPDTANYALLCAITLIIAAISWKFIEQPFRSKDKFTQRSIFSMSLCACIIVFITGLIIIHLHGIPQRLKPAALKLHEARLDTNPRTKECHADPEKNITPESACTYGYADNIHMALLGDSHADALAHTLGQELEKNGTGFLQFTYTGCPPVQHIYRIDQGLEHQCSAYNQTVQHYILHNENIEYVILLARWALYIEGDLYNNGEGGIEYGPDAPVDIIRDGERLTHNEQDRKELVTSYYKQAVEEYLNAGKKVILIYTIPEAGWHVPLQTAKIQQYQDTASVDLSVSYESFMQRNKAVNTAFDSIPEHKNLFKIKTADLFCNTTIKGRCLLQKNGIPLYSDDDHLSNAGNAVLTKEIIKIIGNHRK